MASSLAKEVGATKTENQKFKSVYVQRSTEKRRKPPQRRDSNTIWISPLSDFKERVEEAKSLLLNNKEVFISAVGPSIPHAINLAMVLQNSFTVAMETTTSTVYQNGDNCNGRKYPSPSIRITINLIEARKSN